MRLPVPAPGFPGYAPYCPYTAGRAAGSGWTAPDMERARAARGRRPGGPASASSSTWAQAPALGRYYARLLDKLGFRTTLRNQSFDEYDIYDPNTRATRAWPVGRRLPRAVGLHPCQLRVRGGGNISRLCDRTLERRIERAVGAPQTDVAAWAAADRRVVDLAPAVPLTNRRSAVLVSERAGNVRTHLAYFTLVDQMWVR